MKAPINRRDFLKHSAVAAAAGCLPNLLPAAARGANDKIALGCIGLGSMGTGNTKNFLGHAEANARLSRPLHNGWTLT